MERRPGIIGPALKGDLAAVLVLVAYSILDTATTIGAGVDEVMGVIALAIVAPVLGLPVAWHAAAASRAWSLAGGGRPPVVALVHAAMLGAAWWVLLMVFGPSGPLGPGIVVIALPIGVAFSMALAALVAVVAWAKTRDPRPTLRGGIVMLACSAVVAFFLSRTDGTPSMLVLGVIVAAMLAGAWSMGRALETGRVAKGSNRSADSGP